MRFAYHCGRRTDHEFFIGIKSKTEQYRARNAIVEAALQTNCDYIMFLDDDHVLDWGESAGTMVGQDGSLMPVGSSSYDLVNAFVKHMEADPQLGIVGAVYYTRGDQCRAVLMKEKDGAYIWLRDDEMLGKLQEVGVQGGGCMFIRAKIFDRIKSPWFEAESTVGLGTDIQICKKASEAGYKVACDTSIHIGHVLSKREIITPQNRHRIAAESAKHNSGADDGMQVAWQQNSALALYRMDAEEYLGMKFAEMGEIARKYDMKGFADNVGDLKAYYASRGKEQLARQVLFHHTEHMRKEMELIHNMVNTNVEAHGAEYGCGSAPVSFELALRGHKIDFIDVDGAGAYDFTKWRVQKRGLAEKCGFKLEGLYDYVLMLDSIEHIENWKEVLADVASHLKEKGALITNYFLNQDYANPEHISMDKPAVKAFLIENNIYPMNNYLWVKQTNLAKEVAA